MTNEKMKWAFCSSLATQLKIGYQSSENIQFDCIGLTATLHQIIIHGDKLKWAFCSSIATQLELVIKHQM